MIKNKQFSHLKKCNYLDDSMINVRCELKKDNMNFNSDYCDAECPMVLYPQIFHENNIKEAKYEGSNYSK